MITHFRRWPPPWLAYLACGLVATGGYFALSSAAAQDVASGLLGISAVVAIVVGVQCHRPAQRVPWYLLAIGDGLAVAGDLIWAYDQDVRGIVTPFPSLADTLYLGSYVVFFVGVLLLARSYAAGWDPAAPIDAAILATGAGVIIWTFLIDPTWTDTSRPLLDRLVAGAYPAVDVLALAAVLHLVLGLKRRTIALQLLILALACSFVTDIVYAILLAQGRYETGHPIDAGWLLVYALHGVVALHPSMRERPAPRADQRADLSPVRLALLATAALTGPALLVLHAVRGVHVDMPVIVGASVLLFLLALGRLRLLAVVLRRSEARFRALVQHADDGIAIVDRAGKTLYQSPSSIKIVGFGPETLLDADIFARVHPDDLGRAQQLFGALLVSPGAISASNLRVRHADGSWRDIEVRATNLLAEPSVGGLVLNYRDISERVQAEVALRASEERLRAVVDAAFDAVITAGADGAIESFNQGAERIFGYAAAEVIGQPLTILMPMRLGAAHEAGLGRYQATGTPTILGRTLELVGRRKDGAEFPLEASLAEGHGGGRAFFTGILRDVSERKAAEAQLRHQATHDSLSGLPNRALFLDRLDHALTRARRAGPTGAVLFLDLDRFKDVNDSLGHAAGDRLLVTVAARLRSGLRDADTLARLGGDEFAVLLEDVTDPGEAARAAERLAHTLDAPILLDGQEHRVTVSIGVVLASDAYTRAEELLRDADVAMYRAKADGKARYAVFDPAMQAAVLARLALERDLRLALEQGEFLLHFQPIIDLRTDCIIEAEALLRWQHTERGLVSPGEFIPLAEETGLIRPLGRWVLREACERAAAWARAGYALTVAVNLTAQEFQQPSLADEVTAILAETGLVPCRLRLEITESLAMRDVEATIATLAALRALGVETAIDDFGTGYSSLASLKRLPVDVLKIDRAFIAALETDSEDVAIVAAIVSLAHTLGVRVVAEGVETAAQATCLRALGCDLAQGYHFARPLPGAKLAAMLAHRLDASLVTTLAMHHALPLALNRR